MIREMTAADIPRALRTDNAAFEKPWAAGDFEAELAKDYAHYYICQDEGGTVGYGGIWCIYETAELIRIAVNAPRKGYGSLIMQRLINGAKERGCEKLLLEVRRTNTAARALYKKFGFSEISVRKGYYDGEDAIIMEKRL